MDPGTALQVAGMVCSASKALYQYFKAVKGYEKDAARIEEQLTWLYNLFKSVESSLRLEAVSKSNRKLLEDALLRCRRDALRLSSLVDQAHPNVDEQIGPVQRFHYPFRKPAIKEVLDQVRICQDQLAFALDILHIDATQHSQALLEETLQSIGQTNENISKASDKVDKVEKTLSSVEERNKARSIVDSLRIERFHERRLTVEDAHAKTFRWIFNERISSDVNSKVKSQSDSDEFTRSKDRCGSSDESRFAAWLKQDGDVFWIRGKAGSGKSTLMKFLVDSQKTQGLLKQWAGTRTLIIPEHFFWVAGDLEQKSRHGMLRSILYQILNALPQLVPDICQKRWSSGVEAARRWSTAELTHALHRCAQLSEIRLCLFIDGLDECSPENEQTGLVDEIFKLASHERLKVVVSSRPWPVFDRCLARKDTILALEDLTKADMLEYVREQLTKHSCGQIPVDMDWNYARLMRRRYRSDINEAERQTAQLVLDILDKSDGVFLWVSIVVSNICQQMLARRPLPILKRYLEEFPPKLEQYFRTQILERVQDTVIADNAVVLKCMTVDRQNQSYRNVAFDMSWILSQKGTDFFDDPLFYLQHESSLPVAPPETMEETVRAFISVCCKDLLSVGKRDSASSEYPWIEFLHRTVFDFLNTHEMQSIINSHVPDHFSTEHTIHMLQILAIKLEVAYGTDETVIKNRLMDCLYNLVNGPHLGFFLDLEPECNQVGSWPSRLVKEYGCLLLRYLRYLRQRSRVARAQEVILSNFLTCLIDRGLDAIAFELLAAIPFVFADERNYDLPLMIALDTNLRVNETPGGINVALIEKLMNLRRRRLDHNIKRGRSASSTTSFWQLFLRHVAFRPRGVTESTGLNIVSSLRFLLPYTSAKDSQVQLESPHYMKDRLFHRRTNPLLLHGPWDEGQTISSLEILRALLPLDDFEAILEECPKSWTLAEVKPD